MALKNAIRLDQIEDPVAAIQAILRRCPKDMVSLRLLLLRLYGFTVLGLLYGTVDSTVRQRFLIPCVCVDVRDLL